MRSLVTTFLLLLTITSSLSVVAQEKTRWQLTDNKAIQWTIEGSTLPHSDNIEMAGRKVAGIVHYTVDSLGMLRIKREVIFPQLHPFIKETDPWWQKYRSYLRETYTDEVLPKFYINEKQFVPGKLKKVTIDGIITFEHEPSLSGVTLTRKFYPSTTDGLFIEEMILTTDKDEMIEIIVDPYVSAQQFNAQTGKMTLAVSSMDSDGKVLRLIKGKPQTIYSRYFAERQNSKEGAELMFKQLDDEISRRQSFLKEMSSNLILETPNPILNQLFAFSKIRASESIFDSKLGPIHSPGGGRYYVGTWANDQAEYVSPFFPYLGYQLGNESAMNTYKAFDSVKSPTYEKIQYAFEVEELPPPSMLDRGDAAMIAYGASQYALARGNRIEAERVWELIAWCLEYNHRNLNEGGVVNSQSDEMEGRIETGTANLSTSSLYYGALTNAQYLAETLGKPKTLIKKYKKQQKALYKSIENYFGANFEGLDTYKYFAEHTNLRHWICLPLVMDIDERRDETVAALFDKLWGDNGVYVERSHPANSEIFWDRGTLYALRGTFRTGATEKSLQRLEEFSKTRLLGERVPYVVEAYPEGAMAHLSAESGLYCRVFTEGLFAITPTSFNSFTMQPRLPKDWNEMALRKVRLFDKDFDIEVKRAGQLHHIKVIDNVSGKTVMDLKDDLSGVLEVEL